MQDAIAASGVIEAPAERVWETVAAGGDVHRWFGGLITSCRLVGSGPGARRTCTMADGAELRERILEVDHAARVFRYAIDQHPLPARGMEGEIRVAALEDGGTRVDWGATYEVDPADSATVRESVRGIYARGIASLGAWCGTTV